MDKREALIELSGQIINGIMSSDGSMFTKIMDRATHGGAASAAVNIAAKMLEKIDEKLKEEENNS